MKAYKCDRCGEFYDKYNSSVYKISKNAATLDLCQNCLLQLKIFVEEPNRVNNIDVEKDNKSTENVHCENNTINYN